MKSVWCVLTAAVLAMAQDKQAQAPAPNVELTVYLLSGATQGSGADDVPQDLSSTVKQLHGLSTYKAYKLSESFVLRGRSSGPQECNQGCSAGLLLRRCLTSRLFSSQLYSRRSGNPATGFRGVSGRE